MLELSSLAGLSFPNGFDPASTLCNGQCFDWIAIENEDKIGNPTSWVGVTIEGYVWRVDKSPVSVSASLLSKDGPPDLAEWWSHYLQAYQPDLEEEYHHWADKDCRKWGEMCCPFHTLPGVRVIHQPLLTTIIAFLASSNNNVSRIQALVHGFYRQFGAEICEVTLHSNERFILSDVFATTALKSGVTTCSTSSLTFYKPPTLVELRKLYKISPSSLEEKHFRDAGWGYRAKFMDRFFSGILTEMQWTTTRAILEDQGGNRRDWCDQSECVRQSLNDELLSIPGIGRKVRDCIMLYSGLANERTPLDTNILKVPLYLIQTEVECEEFEDIREFLDKALSNKGVYDVIHEAFVRRYGRLAGWAQSCWFMFIISNPQEFTQYRKKTKKLSGKAKNQRDRQIK